MYIYTPISADCKNVFKFTRIYLNAIRFNPLQFCPSVALVGIFVFDLNFSTVLSCHFDISVNSMTNWLVLKLPFTSIFCNNWEVQWPSC